MAKKIRSEDLFQGDVFKDTRESAEATLNVVKSLRDEFKDLGKNLEKSLSGQKLNDGKDLKKFNEQLEKVNENTEKLTKLEKEEIRLKEKLKDLTSDQAKENAKLKEEIREQNQVVKRSVKLDKAKKGSLAEMRLQLAANKKAYIGLSEEERNNANVGGVLLAKIQEQTTELKELEAQIGVTSRNVGNYKESIKEAFNEMGGFNASIVDAIDSSGVLGGIIGKLNGLIATLSAQSKKAAAAQSQMATNTTKSAKAFKLFNSVLKASVIGAIVVALASMVAFLSRTQAGLDKVSTVLESMNGLLELLIGRLLNVFNGLGDIISGIGKTMSAWWSAITLNFDEAEKKFGEAKDSFVEGGKSMKEAFSGVGDEIKEVLKQAEKIVQFDNERRRRAIDLKKRIAELNAESEKAEEIEGDNTRSFKEREQAIIRSAKAQKESSELQLQLLADELELLKRRQALKPELTLADEEELNEIQLRILESQKDFDVKSLALLRVRNQLEQDLLEKNLDILIDGFDNQKTLNERQVANDLLTFKERRKILEDTVKLGKDSLDKQVEQLQLKAKKTIDINDLVNTSDAVALNKKIRALGLSEILEGRLLEVIRDRRTAIQDLGEAEEELNQKQLELEKKFVEEFARVQIENIEQKRDREIEAENLAFARRRKEIQAEFETLKTQEEINELIEQEEIKHQEKLDDINISALERRGALRRKEIELQMLKEGQTAEEIQNALIKDRIDALKEEINLRKELGEQSIDQELELQKLLTKKTQDEQKQRMETLQSGAEIVGQIINKTLDKRLEAIDAEINASKEKEEQLIEAAKVGNELAQESIALERQRQAELESERAQALKRQEELALALAGINAYTSKVASGDPDPVGSVLRDISLLMSGLKAFEKGGLVEGDEQIIRVNEKGEEFVLNHKATQMLGVDTLNEVNKGNLSALERINSGGDSQIALSYALSELKNDFKKAVQEIPRQHFDISNITGGILEVQKEGSRLLKKHHQKVKRLQ